MPHHSRISIRKATDSDLEALTWIGISAFPHEPQWPYRYPNATEYPEEHIRYTRMRYSEWLLSSAAGHCVIMVAEVPSRDDETQPMVISMSIWRIPQVGESARDKMKPPKPDFRRQDANPLHVAAYRKSIEFAQHEIFDHIAGPKQLSIAQLATHPEYWRRGAATALLNWGVALSRLEGWPITVFVGPMAYSLYSKFGFKTAGKVVAKVAGEDEAIQFPAMIWEPLDSGYFQGQQPPQLVVAYDPVTQS